MPSKEFFRAGVGLAVIDSRGMVLAFERADRRGSWQLPQGGIERSEAPLDAARRELFEETRIAWDDVVVIDEHPVWLAYELPVDARSAKTGRGQVHRWFLARFDGSEADICLDGDDGSQEFVAWRWMRFDDLADLTWEVRRPVYRQLEARWSRYLAAADDDRTTPPTGA